MIYVTTHQQQLRTTHHNFCVTTVVNVLFNITQVRWRLTFIGRAGVYMQIDVWMDIIMKIRHRFRHLQTVCHIVLHAYLPPSHSSQKDIRFDERNAQLDREPEYHFTNKYNRSADHTSKKLFLFFYQFNKSFALPLFCLGLLYSRCTQEEKSAVVSFSFDFPLIKRALSTTTRTTTKQIRWMMVLNHMCAFDICTHDDIQYMWCI